MVTGQWNDVVPPVLRKAQQDAVCGRRVQMLQHGSDHFVAFLQQYLRHIERRAPLGFEHEVLQAFLGDIDGGLCHRAFLATWALSVR